MKKVFSVLALLFLLPAVAFAADFRKDNVGKDENVKNVYVAGQNVTSDANVKSDLVAAGGNVTVNGSVESSLLAAGGTVEVKGTVGKNVRVAGGTVIIDGNVGEDLVVFGGEVTVKNSSTISGDVIVAGGKVTIDGTINGNLRVLGSGQATLTGTVKGTVDANVDQLTVKSSAVINGNLNYSSPNSANIESGAKIVGTTKYSKVETSNKAEGAAAGSLFFTIVSGLIAALLVVYLLPKTTANFVVETFSKPWLNLLFGFLAVIAIPIVVIMLFITVFGFKIGIFLLLAYFLALMLAGALAAILAGALTFKLVQKTEKYEVDWKTAIIGVLILGVLALIPVLGWLAGAIIYLIAVGGLVIYSFNYLKIQRS